MNCNYACNKCVNFYKTTSVVNNGKNLVLTIPNTASGKILNCQDFCICVAQNIPSSTGIVNVVINVNGASYTAITECCANNLYSDQITSRRVYRFRFATDTNCFILKSKNICKTKYIFPVNSVTNGSVSNNEQ